MLLFKGWPGRAPSTAQDGLEVSRSWVCWLIYSSLLHSSGKCPASMDRQALDSLSSGTHS